MRAVAARSSCRLRKRFKGVFPETILLSHAMQPGELIFILLLGFYLRTSSILNCFSRAANSTRIGMVKLV